MLPITTHPLGRYVYFSAKGAGLDPPISFQGRQGPERWLLVGKCGEGGVQLEARERECTCLRCFSFRLHWLRQPAKETQNTSISQGRGAQIAPTATPPSSPSTPVFRLVQGESWPKPSSILAGWENLPLVVRGSQDTPTPSHHTPPPQAPPPEFAWPFKSSRAPIANTNPATTGPWGLSEK